MIVSLIVAMSTNNVIGQNGQLPWHLPADLKHFKALTTGKPIVMGRKTYESIGRPLPDRHNIVVTGQRDWQADGCTVVNSIDAAIAAAGDADELMVIGGAEIYRQFLPLANRIYLTRVDAVVDGDVFFPALEPAAWNESSRTEHAADKANAIAMAFVTFERDASSRG